MKVGLPKTRTGKFLLSLLVLMVAWLITLGAMIWTFGERDEARPSDCAIVLGAAAYGAEPSPVFAERLRHAVALFKAGTVSKLVFTGGFGKDATHAESAVAAAYAIRAGVPEAAILTEAKSHTTRENLLEARTVMTAAGLTSAIIVSDPLHMKRSITMARDLGIAAVSSPTRTSRYVSFRARFGFLLREIYFHHHYWVARQ